MELNEDARKIIARLCQSYYNFPQMTTSRQVALNDLLAFDSPCSIRAVPITTTEVPHEGDLLIGFYALKPIEFCLRMTTPFPFYISTEPEVFQPIHHKLSPNKFAFAYTKHGNDFAINKIGMQYYDIQLSDISVALYPCILFCLYGYLQTKERKELLESRATMLYICPNLKHRMASKIQRQWRESISNPSYLLCRKRLLKEATELSL